MIPLAVLALCDPSYGQQNPLTGASSGFVTNGIKRRAKEISGRDLVDPEGHEAKVSIVNRPTDPRLGAHTQVDGGRDGVAVNLSQIWAQHGFLVFCDNYDDWQAECPSFNARLLLELAALSLVHEGYHVAGVGGGTDVASAPHVAIEFTQAKMICDALDGIIDTYPPAGASPSELCEILARALAMSLYIQRRSDLFTQNPEVGKAIQEKANQVSSPPGQLVDVDHDGISTTPRQPPGPGETPPVEYPPPAQDAEGNPSSYGVDNSFYPTCDLEALCG